jgi:uncharacterized protein
MRSEIGEPLALSATDLSNFLNCRHRTALDLQAARGAIVRPHWQDPVLDALIRRGLEHERRYVESLRAEGKQVVSLAGIVSSNDAVAATLDAMRAGADVIVQAALRHDRWFGRPDVLLRAGPGRSEAAGTAGDAAASGAWMYEPADTKLARETSGGTIMQLGLYCELLARIQGQPPERFHVVTPNPVTPVQTFRVDDYAAYFRLIRERCVDTLGDGDGETAEAIAAANYPEPVDHCDVCHWSGMCQAKRRKDDHLSLVAGISGLQRRELEARAVKTMGALAALPVPMPFKPARGAAETYMRVREQARVQVAARDMRRPVHELIEPIEPGTGLCRLPPPSRGDLFLDIEGDRFADEDGREYLFGLVSLDERGSPGYRAFWAGSRAEERRAFDAIVSAIVQAWADDPGMHVYHFAPYEPAALKRLMGRYASHEQALDRLLRAERFVDLYAVVRQGVRAGVERYSIKDLEPCYAFTRQVPLRDANRHLRVVEQALELDSLERVTEEVRRSVEGYNQDDCVSTFRLREWLEALRAGVEANGTPVPRPQPQDGEASEDVDERAQRVEELRGRLLQGVPEDARDRSTEQQSRWLLAYLLDWHRREDKGTWWEYYRLRDLAPEDLFDEARAVAGLEFVERVDRILNKRSGKPTGSVVDRYRYPQQELELRAGNELILSNEDKWADVVSVDRVQRTLVLKKGPAQAETHATAAFEHAYVRPKALVESIDRIAEAIANGEPNPLVRGLLDAEPPRLRAGQLVAQPGESSVARAVRIVNDLDRTVLAIQGPPGAGKTFTGAEMICALVVQGKRVGVTANSHAVIRHLLDAVAEAATKQALSITLAHRRSADDDEDVAASTVRIVEKNPEAAQLLASREVQVLGGTAWLWAHEDLVNAVDVLFVDEAGQMALANVVAVTPATNSLVLLGDPQQLEQPKKGSHPEGVGVSALQHLLGGHQTIPDDRGIFLPETWRLAPRICQLTSELFYEGKLTSKPSLVRQRLAGEDGLLGDGGLWIVEVEHEGNRNASDEEVDAVVGCVRALTAAGSRWVDETGAGHQMTGADILVVAPFNAQVSRLAERLDPLGVRAGTVDKFQGQEAPVVIYSMATSRPEDAPRGLEFLYSPNRLNVATSRARCAAVIVASPHLFAPDCRTPRQMRLANALCRYRELARSRRLADLA